MLPPIFIGIWILTGVALAVYIARIAIRIQTKKLGYDLFLPISSVTGAGKLIRIRMDDLFLGIGAAILLETYILGTVLYGWVLDMWQAIEGSNYVWIFENDKKIVQYWYSASATYIFSIVWLPLSPPLLSPRAISYGCVFSGPLRWALPGFYADYRITSFNMDDGRTFCFIISSFPLFPSLLFTSHRVHPATLSLKHWPQVLLVLPPRQRKRAG